MEQLFSSIDFLIVFPTFLFFPIFSNFFYLESHDVDGAVGFFHNQTAFSPNNILCLRRMRCRGSQNPGIRQGSKDLQVILPVGLHQAHYLKLRHWVGNVQNILNDILLLGLTFKAADRHRGLESLHSLHLV